MTPPTGREIEYKRLAAAVIKTQHEVDRLRAVGAVSNEELCSAEFAWFDAWRAFKEVASTTERIALLAAARAEGEA